MFTSFFYFHRLLSHPAYYTFIIVICRLIIILSSVAIPLVKAYMSGDRGSRVPAPPLIYFLINVHEVDGRFVAQTNVALRSLSYILLVSPLAYIVVVVVSLSFFKLHYRNAKN